MNTNRHLPLPARSFVAVLLIVVCVLFLMAWAEVAFRDSGSSAEFVRYASRIAGLPLLTFLVWLVVREHRAFLRGLYSTQGLTLRLLVTGVFIGILARIFWWSQTTARIAFGWIETTFESPPQLLSIGIACPELHILLMAVLVWCVLVPFTEEFVHRGILMSAMSNRGPFFAIGVSAIIFALSHDPDSYLFVAFFGVVFGILFWNVRTLWVPVVAHATYDGLQFFDWYCLRVSWNPIPSELPLATLGLASAVIAAASLAGIGYLIGKRWVGPHAQPNP